MKMLLSALAATALSFSVPALGQVPPPPLLVGQSDLASRLVSAFDRKNAADYAILLSPSVQVYNEGVLVARNKAEWMHRFGAKLAAPGVTFRLSPGYASPGRLLFIEYFNSMASWGSGPPRDCCWGYTAVAYDISGGKIVKIQRLNGGTARLDDKGSPAPD